MVHFLLTWLLSACALIITAQVVPGFTVAGLGAAAIAAVVLGLINAIVRPILVFLTLPLTLLTLGLFLLVINALMILLAGAITPGFSVGGFIPAVLGSLVLTLVSSVLHWLLGQ